MLSIFKTDIGKSRKALEDMLAEMPNLPEDTKKEIRKSFRKGFKDGRKRALSPADENLLDIKNYLTIKLNKPKDFYFFGFAIGYIFFAFKYRVPIDVLVSEGIVSSWLAVMKGKHKSFRHHIGLAALEWKDKFDKSQIPLNEKLSPRYERLKAEIEEFWQRFAA